MPLSLAVALAAPEAGLAQAAPGPGAGAGPTAGDSDGAGEHPAPIHARVGRAATDSDARANDIVVVGSPPDDAPIPGSVKAPQKPVATLNEEDVKSYGANSIEDLLDAIAPETNSGRGRGAGMPVILVNGQRISSFRELRDYPPEAIRRVEIWPEEVALRYGYAPDQRVVNFILKDNFASKVLEVEGTEPTRGGTSTEQGQASMLRINKGDRFNASAKVVHTSPLTEAERGVRQSRDSVSNVPGDPDPADARTLVAEANTYTGNMTWTKALGKETGAGTLAVNATASRADTTALSGLAGVSLQARDGPGGALTSTFRTLPGALVRATRTDSVSAGATLNKPFGDWQLTATVDGTHALTTTRSDTGYDTTAIGDATLAGLLSPTGPLPGLTPLARDTARSTSNSVTSLVTLVGHPVKLPGGQVTSTVKAGFAWTGLSSSDSRFNLGTTRLNRGDASAGINLGIPITSRRESFGGAVGDITLNFSAGLDHLSDFGDLKDWSGGVTWGVTQKLNLQASYIVNQAAPSLAQLGNARTLTPNVAVYDFVAGQTVLVSEITGGNRDLQRQQQRDLKLGLNWTLPIPQRANLIVEYFDNHSYNVSTAFPLLTPAIEAAYPGRVSRSPVTGAIISIDARPVTLAYQHESRLRWGFNVAGNLGKPIVAGTGGLADVPGMAAIRSAAGGAMRSGGGQRGDRAGGGSDLAAPPPPPDAAGEPPADGARGGGFGGRPGGGGGFGGPPGGGPPGGGGPGGGARGQRYEGRWNVSFYHTVQFVDRVTLAPGTAPLDLLGGDAIASNGGVARHSFELDAGGFFKGFGLRTNGTWSAPTHVKGSGVPGSSDLRFGSVFKLNARLFVDLGAQQRLVNASSFWKGARLSILVNNVFDQRQRVTDASGVVPVAYQPDLIDPLGRVIGIELRKMF